MELRTIEFIEKAVAKHEEKYDYSKVNYINGSTNVTIICKIHKTEFIQLPNNHIRGANCPTCAIESRRKKRKTPIDEFINKANEKFNKRFDYSKINYINSDTNITIVCPNHGEFLQTPYQHLKSKFGCNKCSNINSLSHVAKNPDKFLEEIKEKFGNTFDYSKVNYVNSSSDIILICNKHKNEFSIKARKLLKAIFGCSYCVTDNKKGLFSKSSEEFIKEANIIHANIFDYSKVNYINCETPIIIICPNHGEFTSTPYQHLNSKTGCQKCSGCHRKNTEEFISTAINIHGELYDYSKVEYINSATKVIIFCKKHNIDFLQTPSMHLSGQKCKNCGDDNSSEKRRYTKEDFIQMAKETHPHILDEYIDIDYINLSTKINITCKIHGVYEQKPSEHLQGHRCSKCGKDKLSLQYRMSLEEFIKRSNERHNNFYDYSSVQYINGGSDVDIICPIHGHFQQNPRNHMKGSMCRRCAIHGCSKVQIAWLKYISSELNINIQHYENGGEHKIKNTKNNRSDGYYEPKNMVFEFHGCYYHGCSKCKFKPDDINTKCKKTFRELYDRTQTKKEHCIKEGYEYIEIWGCEWTKASKSDESLKQYIIDLKMRYEFL